MRALAVVLTLSLGLVSCTVTRGSGQVETVRREVSGFDRVELDGSATVIVRQGDGYSLELEADDNIIDLLTYEVDDDTLVLGIEPGNTIMFASEVTFTVRMPDVAGVRVEGSGRAEVVDVDLDRLKVSIEGSGDVIATGTVDILDLAVEGSGEFDGERLEARDADVWVNGSGEALVAVTDDLEAEVDGSGSIVHIGQPDSLSVDVDGSGEVRRQ